MACSPSIACVPTFIQPLYRQVSGTYRSPTPSGYGRILELRVDVDGRRPQNRVSGDIFYRIMFFCFSFTIYIKSFVVENLVVNQSGSEMVITGPVKYYNDPTNTSDTIEVRIPRVSLNSTPASATVKFYTSSSLAFTYLCPKTSEFLRTVTLEIDSFQGTTFPPTANTHVDPHPADLTNENLNTAVIFQRAGIDMTVTQDDVLNDPDGGDPGNNWDEAELHDLMENRFDLFVNTLNWNCYGVVVPRFGDGAIYNSGAYGVMFDWGPWQAGDTYHRQGAAIAFDALTGRTSGTLYNTNAKRDRFFLETFVHEIGHVFNLPHTWSRSTNPDSASDSFMNYPWGYTGGGGITNLQQETNFWSNFRWEFDDEELIWMRHADRKDVIFGGVDWIGNNLSIYTEPEMELTGAPLSLEVRSQDVFDYTQPVRVELKLKNISDVPLNVNAQLEPEDMWVTFYLIRPDGERVRYVPPVHRFTSPIEVELAPGAAIYESVMLSYSAKGPQFQEPGEYKIRAYYNLQNRGMIVSPTCRLRVASPTNRSTDELAHLLFGYRAAKFVYFGGTERYPETKKQLRDAAKNYAKTDPTAVRNIQAALGRHESRDFKRLILKSDTRVVSVREANLKEAVYHLEAARKLLPTKRSAFDNISYNRLSSLSARCYTRQDKPDEAVRVLKESQRYLRRRNVLKSVLDDYQRRIKDLS